MGDFEVMQKYNKVIDKCIYLLKNNLADIHPETLTLANLQNENINVLRFYSQSHICRN